MIGALGSPDASDRRIFDAYFETVLDESDFLRASAIFEALGLHNERSVATQIETARQFDKLGEVLGIYELLTAPDSFMHRVPDAISAAVAVRQLVDVVYLDTILDGDPANLFKRRRDMEMPTVFNTLGAVGGSARLN